jgi:hypothetical protein
LFRCSHGGEPQPSVLNQYLLLLYPFPTKFLYFLLLILLRQGLLSKYMCLDGSRYEAARVATQPFMGNYGACEATYVHLLSVKKMSLKFANTLN